VTAEQQPIVISIGCVKRFRPRQNFKKKKKKLGRVRLGLVTSQKPQTNELQQRKVTQTKKGNTKHNQTTTILFFTLLLTYGFLETIQIQTHEENIE
jgi:hypothetical protein